MLYDENVTFDSVETEEYLKEQCKKFGISNIIFEEGYIITKNIIDELIDSILDIGDKPFKILINPPTNH